MDFQAQRQESDLDDVSTNGREAVKWDMMLGI